MGKIKKETGIVVAIDRMPYAIAKQLAKDLGRAEGNFVIKYGRPFEAEYGLGALADLKRVAGNVPIIYDGKIADIPDISKDIATSAYDLGADAVICQGFVGPDTVEALVKLNQGDVIVVVEMTHPGAVKYIQPVSEKIAGDVNTLGAHGAVVPATRPERVKELVSLLGDNVYIIAPGIKAQGAKAGDAIINGATYEVIGRAITGAEDPLLAAETLYEEILERKRASGNLG